MDTVSYLQAAKRGLRNVRPSRWINLMLSFLSTTSLLSERRLSSIDCRTLGAGKEGTKSFKEEEHDIHFSLNREKNTTYRIAGGRPDHRV